VRHHPPLLKYSYSPVTAPSQLAFSKPESSTSSAFQPYQQQHQKHSKSSSAHASSQQQSQNQQPLQPPPIPVLPHSLPQSANQHASSLVAARGGGQPKGFLQHFQDQLNTNSEKIAEMALIKECDIEKFAQENLNFSKGIFRKKSSVRDMLSFTSEAITKPMLSITRDKMGKKMAIEQFKLVQIYMGDRKARIGMSLNSVAIDIITLAVANSWLRDELYVQLSRQTTENPKRESLIRGWELMAICLSFVPPSPTFQPALLGYMNRHRDPGFTKHFQDIVKWPIHVQVSHYSTIACRRLERIGSSGKKQAKKPAEDEINQARVSKA
jgi:Rho GTPase-activating protein 39